jgi:hypothetical protein
MRIWRRTLVVIALALAGMSEGALGQVGTSDWTKQTPAQIEDRIETKHPAAYFILAIKLFEAGRRDDATFWFYVGQIRYRAYLLSNPKLDPSGDPALFSSLFATAGPTINGYAFGDIPQLMNIIDRALDWDAKHPDGLTPKSPKRDEVRDGLVKLKSQIASQRDEIRATRTKNGLENRN